MSLRGASSESVEKPWRREHARAFLDSASLPLAWQPGARHLAKSNQRRAKSTHFIVEVRGADVVVSLLNGKFKATYYKPAGRPNLNLRERTKTDVGSLPAEAFQAALRRWIVERETRSRGE